MNTTNSLNLKMNDLTSGKEGIFILRFAAPMLLGII